MLKIIELDKKIDRLKEIRQMYQVANDHRKEANESFAISSLLFTPLVLNILGLPLSIAAPIIGTAMLGALLHSSHYAKKQNVDFFKTTKELDSYIFNLEQQKLHINEANTQKNNGIQGGITSP